MIKMFWHPKTRAARAVWMLEELGEPYEIVEIDIKDPDKKYTNPEFMAASPMGKVPAISDGEVAISDSAAICLYLADKYPAAALAPGIDDPLRGAYLYWMTYTPGVIEPAMMEKISGAESNRYSYGWGDFDLMIKVLEQGVGNGPWLLGEKFSAADVMTGMSVVFMRNFGMLPEGSSLNAYADRCEAREGHVKAEALEGE